MPQLPLAGRTRPLILALALAAPAFGLAGCDEAADLIGVDQFDVNLGSNAVLPLVPNTSVAAPTGEVDVEQNLPDVFDIERISIPEDAVTYQSPAPAAGGGGAVCHVRLFVMIDRVPVLQADVHVDEEADPEVQEVTSRYARPYDRDEICSGLDDCPVTNQDLSSQEIRDHVDDAVASGRFDVDFVASNDGPCAGVLAIERLHFELDF